MKVITLATRATDRIPGDMDLIMALRVQLQSQSATGHTMFAGPDIGMEARITSGGQVTGRGEMAGKSGFTAITLCADTKPRSRNAESPRLPSRHQSAD